MKRTQQEIAELVKKYQAEGWVLDAESSSGVYMHRGTIKLVITDTAICKWG